MSGKPPAGWFPYGTHKDMDPVPMLLFSEQKNRAGRPLWERPMVVCTEDICGTPTITVEPGVTLCLQFCQPTVRRFCKEWRDRRAKQELPIAAANRRRRQLAEQIEEDAERTVGQVRPPDRFSFRGTYVKEVGGGLPTLGENAR